MTKLEIEFDGNANCRTSQNTTFDIVLAKIVNWSKSNILCKSNMIMTLLSCGFIMVLIILRHWVDKNRVRS